MKVLHLPFSYFPDPVGGAELYVEALARDLQRWDIESVICAPGRGLGSYVHANLRVRRFEAMRTVRTLDESYSDGDAIAAKAFANILSSEQPDLVHFHALTPEVSPRLARDIKACGIPLVFTYHACAATCQVGTLVRWGRVACDGEMITSRCAACNLHRRGMPKALAAVVGHMPVQAGRIVKKFHLEGPIWTALRMSELIDRKQSAVKTFLDIADGIVAPSEWVREVLLSNGVPRSKITLCEQGLVSEAPSVSRTLEAKGNTLRIVALARLDPTKGMDVLVSAFEDLPGLDLALDIYGMPHLGRNAGHQATALGQRISRDKRIRLLPPVPHREVLGTISRYDVLAVPSQLLETGPLVVLEAFAAGVPVLGSDLGGISERVIHEKNGLLVPPFNRAAWVAALRRLAVEPGLLERLSGGISPPPGMGAVAEKMRALYLQLTSSPSYLAKSVQRMDLRCTNPETGTRLVEQPETAIPG